LGSGSAGPYPPFEGITLEQIGSNPPFESSRAKLVYPTPGLSSEIPAQEVVTKLEIESIDRASTFSEAQYIVVQALNI
jgi:hypothetical protein